MPFSLWILLALLLACGLAVWMFFELSRQWVNRRHWTALSQWARNRGFTLESAGQRELPPPLMELLQPRSNVILALRREDTTLLELQPTDRPLGQWNVLIRRVGKDFVPVALRPISARTDWLISRILWPCRGGNERFEVLSASEQAASSLQQSSAQTLLPQDIGLLLHGPWMLLEFSDRPFDPIEFSRMLALSDQLEMKMVGSQSQ